MTTASGRRDVCRRSIRFEFVTFPFFPFWARTGTRFCVVTRRFTTRMGTGRRGGGGFVRIKVCLYSLLRAVFRDRCVLQRRCRAWRLVSDESALRSLRDERESRFSVSLSASRRFEVSSTKKREENERFFTFPTIPHAKRPPAFPVVLEVFPFDGEKNGETSFRQSLSLARARSRRNGSTSRRDSPCVPISLESPRPRSSSNS